MLEGVAFCQAQKFEGIRYELSSLLVLRCSLATPNGRAYCPKLQSSKRIPLATSHFLVMHAVSHGRYSNESYCSRYISELRESKNRADKKTGLRTLKKKGAKHVADRKIIRRSEGKQDSTKALHSRHLRFNMSASCSEARTNMTSTLIFPNGFSKRPVKINSKCEWNVPQLEIGTFHEHSNDGFGLQTKLPVQCSNWSERCAEFDHVLEKTSSFFTMRTRMTITLVAFTLLVSTSSEHVKQIQH